MNAAAGLLRRCFHDMIPEPIYFVPDDDGNYHLPFDAPPPKTVIDVRGGFDTLQGVKILQDAWQVTIECDGRSLVYERIGRTIHGEWVCKLRRGNGESE
jgi:hypothetical protein